ncbi:MULTISPECIES: hypothetical protein [unclassified Alistipes]|uniref:hypothetical protein n=1 Tax=unclassified Alistipes TaxID=2608932 RepID=UPI002583F4ED|nr:MULTISPECIES: hypothetical protein [unclassified Alistipes]HUN14473.1 hypothetical protein [Alistipes sp.]
MKRFAFKFISVIAAFLIGVSINNSCGESPMDEDSSIYNSIRALQNEVTNLKQEIERLDSELAALQASGGGSQGGASSEKYIDGLYFWHGSPTGLIKHYISSGYEYTTEYTYDKYGRIIERITHNISPSESTGKVSYEYVGKTVIQTITIDKYPDLTNQTITEYY